MEIQTKQQKMYVDIIKLVAEIAREGFGIDLVNNPLFKGIFENQIQKHHNKLVKFIEEYAPVEQVPPVSIPSQEVPKQELIQSQPVNESGKAPWPEAQSPSKVSMG